MRALCTPICALAFAVLPRAQSELPKDVIQLAQLKRDVGADLATLGNYTCVTTIERSQRGSARQPFEHLDTVRLEVAVVDNRELYSWPGANEFGERAPGDLVRAGLTSTGSFAAAIKTALANNISTITWHGEETIRGRRAIRWDYTVPYNLSRWTIYIEGRGGRMSQSGSFWAEAETLDLLRLEINAHDIPPDLPVMGLRSTIDYARVPVRSRKLLLPQSAEVVLSRLNGVETRNRIEFSQCREFAAESTLTFDAPAAAAVDKPPAPVAELQVPAGLQLSVRMAQAVDSKWSAVGDNLTATVDAPVSYHGAVLIPRGAVLQGRIRLLERQTVPRLHYLVGLEFNEIEFGGHHARFTGEMIGVQPLAGLSEVFETSTVDTRAAVSAVSITTSARTERETPVRIPGVGTFFMDGPAFHIPEGMQMTWRSAQLGK